MKSFLMSARGAAVVAAVLVVAAAVWINVRGADSAGGGAVPAAWTLETHEGGAGSLEHLGPASSSDSLRVEISNLGEGAAGWHVKIFRASYQIEAGTRYRVSFRARAEATRPVGCAMGNNHEPWQGLGEYHEHAVMTDWITFECPFTAVADDSDARLFFDLGASDAWVEIAQISVRDETNGSVLEPD